MSFKVNFVTDSSKPKTIWKLVKKQLFSFPTWNILWVTLITGWESVCIGKIMVVNYCFDFPVYSKTSTQFVGFHQLLSLWNLWKHNIILTNGNNISLPQLSFYSIPRSNLTVTSFQIALKIRTILRSDISSQTHQNPLIRKLMRSSHKVRVPYAFYHHWGNKYAFELNKKESLVKYSETFQFGTFAR